MEKTKNHKKKKILYFLLFFMMFQSMVSIFDNKRFYHQIKTLIDFWCM